MKTVIIVVLIIIVVGLALYLINNRRKKLKAGLSANNQLPSTKEGDFLNREKVELDIPIEMIPADLIKDESALVEIKDSKVLARIDSAIPQLARGGVTAANVAKDNAETIYRVIIPKRAKLTKSRDMEGAFRGFYRGSKNIRGHANLVEVEKAGTSVANIAAGAMDVASLVVGQYYMAQINAELGEINKNVKRIESFQDNEFRSRVFALVAQVQKIALFNTEILTNSELLNIELTHVNSLEDECVQLLGQANLTIGDYAKKKDIDYKTYEEEVQRAQKWYGYQQTLLEVLYKIADLKYTLQFGKVSRKQCGALLSTYDKQVEKSRNRLLGWHEACARKLGVDISEIQRRRSGFDRAIHWVPGLIDKKQNYRPIEEGIAEMITTQITEREIEHKQGTSELFSEDVQIISKNGKLYYLPLVKE